MNGYDILTQAKSGMGKTAIFVLTVLNRLEKEPEKLSALVLCHTRELAYQIQKEFRRFSKYLQNLKIEVMYGGEPIDKHVKILNNDPPHVLVGTPGRILALIRRKVLKLDKMKFFIVDECDKVLSQLDMRADVQRIFMATPHDKQVMMFSATLAKDIRPVCKKFMRNPFEVFIDDESKLKLHGLQQYYVKLSENEKNRKLSDLLDALLFNQVIIFVRTVARAIELNNLLNECNFPSICIHRDLSQEERIKRYQNFKDFQKRIMVATDIFGRGIDIDRVNIVINYDMPDSSDTYLHRVGRAGRFGTKGLAITFVGPDNENSDILEKVQKRFEVNIQELPDQIDVTSYMNSQAQLFSS
eukprot:TRINITY_DN976_c0_g1_i1.p1 TRINITY_DN976_c0_g1~~TRINITY_DN976_c0_g1_i1.p1  ORF type:complete len:356 (+),score=61.38 TRINITY_DN976_c0_g1_i1:307-1374(+)